MTIALIAAIADNGVIGAAGKIPWHIRDDLQRFKRLTTGHPILMGRKTYASLGRPLPSRRNIVLTRGPAIAGIECFATLKAALSACTETTESDQRCHPEPVEGSQSLNAPRAPAEICGEPRLVGLGFRSAQNDKPQKKVFIIGGAEIYRLALPLADILHLTHVHQTPAGDTSFPDYDRSLWREVHREDYPGYSFVDYRRA